jgi:hypothetical protein
MRRMICPTKTLSQAGFGEFWPFLSRPCDGGAVIFEACFSVEAGTVRPESPVRDRDRSVFPRQR